MDTCIALRTAVVKDGTMFIQAGAGIVVRDVAERINRRSQDTRALRRPTGVND
jgi:anthranilate synthase component I